jgi:hypothetical protein
MSPKKLCPTNAIPASVIPVTSAEMSGPKSFAAPFKKLIPVQIPSYTIAAVITNQGRSISPDLDRVMSALGIFPRKLPVEVTTAQAVVIGVLSPCNRNARPRVAGEKFPARNYARAVTVAGLKSAVKRVVAESYSASACRSMEWNKLPVKRTP